MTLFVGHFKIKEYYCHAYRKKVVCQAFGLYYLVSFCTKLKKQSLDGFVKMSLRKVVLSLQYRKIRIIDNGVSKGHVPERRNSLFILLNYTFTTATSYCSSLTVTLSQHQQCLFGVSKTFMCGHAFLSSIRTE